MTAIFDRRHEFFGKLQGTLMSNYAFLVGSILGPIASVTFCSWWWRDKRYLALLIFGATTAGFIYAVDLNRYGSIDGGFRSLIIGALPIVGGWLYHRYVMQRSLRK